MRIKSISGIGKKKGVMTQIINIFILVLVISVLSGMTFLFVSSLKVNVLDMTATTTGTVTNESGAYLNITGYTLDEANAIGFRSPVITAAWNVTGTAALIPAGNYTVSSVGVLTNATVTTWADVNVSYTYTYVGADEESAYKAVNATEAAGYNVTKYLSLLFLALIFGAVLIVVLRVILPYINLGQQIGGGF